MILLKHLRYWVIIHI